MTMTDVFAIVDAVQSLLNKLQVLEDIIAEILKQTVKCAIFLCQYTDRGFGGPCCMFDVPDKFISESRKTNIFRH
jgi:hypothetical protein